jgi:transcriptional regulator with XRE-family HTH domain
MQDPVGGEGGPLPKDLGIDRATVGTEPPTAAGVRMDIHAGTAREEARQQTAGHDTGQELAARSGWWLQRLVRLNTFARWECGEHMPRGDYLETLLHLTGLPTDALVRPMRFLAVHPDFLCDYA